MNLAQLIDATPVVQSSTDRGLKFPAPPTDQRVFNKGTGNTERWNGAAWVVDSGGAAAALGWFNVTDAIFGGVADGVTETLGSFQAATTAAGVIGGTVAIPATASFYKVGGTITYSAGVYFLGLGHAPTLKESIAGQTLFQFVGASELAPLNAHFQNLVLDNLNGGTGCAIRARNFQPIFLENVSIVHYKQGLWADWGNAVFVNHCQIVLNERGIQVGGNLGGGTPAAGAGIRAAPQQNNPGMDLVVIRDTVFSSNQVDINDMGSIVALGGLTISGCTFYEGPAVAGKFRFISLTARKGWTVEGCWFECQQAARTMVFAGAFDYDGNAAAVCSGGNVRGNDFLYNVAGATSIGVDPHASDCLIEGNTFEFAAGARPISLSDNTRASTVRKNAYLTYPDIAGYVDPVNIGTPAVPHIIQQDDFLTGDRGDNNVVLKTFDTTINSYVTQRFATNLTGNKTVTLPAAAGSLWNGAHFRIVRTGLGAFTLDVGGLKVIPNATAAFVDVMYDGAAWRLTGYGTL